MEFFTNPLGQAYITTGAPSANALVNGGLLFEPNGQLVLGTPAPTDVYIGGLRVNANGAVCRTASGGPAYDYNSGLQLSRLGGSEGAVVRNIDVAPDAVDPFINCGLRVDSGIEGMCMVTAVPPIGAQQLTNPDFLLSAAGWSTFQATLNWIAASQLQVIGTVNGSQVQLNQAIPVQAVQLGWTYRIQARIRNIDVPGGPRVLIARGLPGGYGTVVQTATVPGTTFVDVELDWTPRFSDASLVVNTGNSSAIGQSFEVAYVRMFLLGI